MAKKSKHREVEVKFLPEDSEWIALQEKIIGLTGKPIEDLKCSDLASLYASLSGREQTAVREHRRNKMQETFAPIGGFEYFGTDEEWENRVCRKSWDWLREFCDYKRAVTVRFNDVKHLNQTDQYAAVILAIKKDLFELLDRYPGLAYNNSGSSNLSLVLTNAGVIPPTEEGFELVRSIYDRLEVRETELNDEKLKQQKSENEDRTWYKKYAARSDDFENLLRTGISVGVITQRGSHLYFNNKSLGNGFNGAAHQVIYKENFALEAEIRVAVAQANQKNSAV